MRVKLQLVMCGDDGCEEMVTDLVTLQKDSTRIEHLGLSLKEAKQLLNTIQKVSVIKIVNVSFYAGAPRADSTVLCHG